MKNLFKYSIVTVILVVAVSYFSSGDFESQIKTEMNKIENQAAQDAIWQYKIAKRNGSGMDAYVQSGLVAAAFLEAEDEANYKKWKELEKEEAKNTGI